MKSLGEYNLLTCLFAKYCADDNYLPHAWIEKRFDQFIELGAANGYEDVRKHLFRGHFEDDKLVLLMIVGTK